MSSEPGRAICTTALRYHAFCDGFPLDAKPAYRCTFCMQVTKGEGKIYKNIGCPGTLLASGRKHGGIKDNNSKNQGIHAPDFGSGLCFEVQLLPILTLRFRNIYETSYCDSGPRCAVRCWCFSLLFRHPSWNYRGRPGPPIL